MHSLTEMSVRLQVSVLMKSSAFPGIAGWLLRGLFKARTGLSSLALRLRVIFNLNSHSIL